MKPALGCGASHARNNLSRLAGINRNLAHNRRNPWLEALEAMNPPKTLRDALKRHWEAKRGQNLDPPATLAKIKIRKAKPRKEIRLI